jgi:hypothetical protein
LTQDHLASRHAQYLFISQVLKVFLIRRDPVTQILDFDTVVSDMLGDIPHWAPALSQGSCAAGAALSQGEVWTCTASLLQVALDAEERAVAREAVVRTTDEADPEQLSLRIRWVRV